MKSMITRVTLNLYVSKFQKLFVVKSNLEATTKDKIDKKKQNEGCIKTTGRQWISRILKTVKEPAMIK